MTRRHFLVSGRVQGVGFRNFVHKQADTFGIEGAVRNLHDGRVEILALGSTSAMAKFTAAVAKGPQYALVNALEVNEIGMTSELERKGFAVVEDGEAPWFFEN